MPTARRPQRPARSRGYTAVEVLIAMTVMAIGAAAVMSMQKASIAGNLDARRTDVANAIARTWVERLRRETMQWTAPGPSNPTGSNFNTMKIVSNVNGQWFLPDQEAADPQAGGAMSPGFDILGRDLAPGDVANALFCVNVRLQWLVPQNLTTTPPEPGLIRADVRVLWPRGVAASPPVGWCNQATAALVNPDPGNSPLFHSIYLTTTLAENPQ